MSAQAIPSPASHSTTIRAACFTPLSYFEHALDLDYTQLRCFGLILVETLGAFPSRPTAEITYAKFAETFQVSKDWIAQALGSLEGAGYIKIGRSERGTVVYSVRDEYVLEVQKAGREKIRGRCPDCKTVGLFSTEFVPTAHAAFRKLGGCVDSATYRVVMVVSRYTCQWDRESRCLKVDPQELDLADFSRLTGLEKREITNGLTNAVKLGLIGRELRAGRPSLFWAVPEKFGALEKRGPRLVTPSESGVTEEAKPETSRNGKNPNKPVHTHANESGVYFYGRCENCNHLVTVEPVSEQEFADSAPKQSQSSAGSVKKPPGAAKKSAYFEELDRRKKAAIADGLRRSG
jgi:hypothetical protein